MAGGRRGATSGVILGLATVVLLQQLAAVDLGLLFPGLTYLVVAGVVGGVVFGLTGRRLERRSKSARPSVQPWGDSPPPDDSPPKD